MTRHLSHSGASGRYARRFVMTALLLGIAALLAYPFTAESIHKEDHLVENLTASVFLIAGVWAGVNFLRRRASSRRIERACLVGAAILGLIGFFDELSFGARLLRLNMPVIAGTRIDAVHDIVQPVMATLRNAVWGSPVGVGLGLIVALGGLTWILRAPASAFWRSLRSVADGSLPSLVTWFGVLLSIALLIDSIEPAYWRFAAFDLTGPSRALEEVLELLAATSVCFAAFAVAPPRRLVGRSRSAPRHRRQVETPRISG